MFAFIRSVQVLVKRDINPVMWSAVAQLGQMWVNICATSIASLYPKENALGMSVEKDSG